MKDLHQALTLAKAIKSRASSKKVVYWGAGRQLEYFINTYVNKGSFPPPDYIIDTTRDLDAEYLGYPVINIDALKKMDPSRTFILITAGLLDLYSDIVRNGLYYYDIYHRKSVEFALFLQGHLEECELTRSLFSTEASRMIYESIACKLVTGAFHSPELYSAFPYVGNQFIPQYTPEDSVCLAGGFNGRHVERFIECGNPHVSVFEPSSYWCSYLKDKFSSFSNIEVVNGLLWSEQCSLPYIDDLSNGGLGAYVCSNPLQDDGTSVALQAYTLSDFYKDNHLDHLVLDVEGSERHVINGLKDKYKSLKTASICIYHNPHDFVFLPQLMNKSSQGKGKLELLHHSNISNIETVAYHLIND